MKNTSKLSKAPLRNANRAFRTQVQIANAKSQKVNEAVFQKGPPKRQIANFRSWTHGKFQIALGGRFETPTRGPSIREVCIYFYFSCCQRSRLSCILPIFLHSGVSGNVACKLCKHIRPGPQQNQKTPPLQIAV